MVQSKVDQAPSINLAYLPEMFVIIFLHFLRVQIKHFLTHLLFQMDQF